MNDMTYTQLAQTNAANQSGIAQPSTHFLTDQLEHLWLLSALEHGIAQAKRGETIVADKAFFDALQSRLFGAAEEEEIIQA